MNVCKDIVVNMCCICRGIRPFGGSLGADIWFGLPVYKFEGSSFSHSRDTK